MEIIADRSGADVAAIDVVVPFVENFGDDIEADDKFAASLMLRHGIPEDVVVALRSVSRSFRAWGAKAKVTRPLHDGELLKLRDRSLEVQHRPGHSPSDTVFWDADRRDPDLRRPPDRAHLLEPAHLPAARRLRRAARTR